MEKNSTLYLEYPRFGLNCANCEKKESNVIRLMLSSDAFSPYKVQVLSFKNEYDKEGKFYKINVELKWECPSCGIPLQEVSKIKEIPIEIIKEVTKLCPICGGSLKLVDEMIETSSLSRYEDIIILKGSLMCDNCSGKVPFTKTMKMAFISILNYIKSVSKIKISPEGIDFERDIQDEN